MSPEKLKLLKKIALLRKTVIHDEVGQLPSELCNNLIEFAKQSSNKISQSLSTRYQQAPAGMKENEDYKSIEENYVQVFLTDDLISEVERVLNLKTTQLRVGIMKPNFGLDWHMDFDPYSRLHCDLNEPSDFLFRIKDKEIKVDKKIGHVYKLNVAHYHKVFNNSNSNRYALIGCLLK